MYIYIHISMHICMFMLYPFHAMLPFFWIPSVVGDLSSSHRSRLQVWDSDEEGGCALLTPIFPADQG